MPLCLHQTNKMRKKHWHTYRTLFVSTKTVRNRFNTGLQYSWQQQVCTSVAIKWTGIDSLKYITAYHTICRQHHVDISPQKMLCIQYILEILIWPIIPQKSFQCSDRLQNMTRTVKPPSAHDQTTNQAGTNQAIIHGYLYDPNTPRQGMTSNQHPKQAERPAFLELQLFHGITSNQHIWGSTFLCYFTKVATGYCWSTMPYSVLFGTTLQSHLTKGFLHRPARERATICCSTTSTGYP